MSDTREFNCAECGTHIVDIAGTSEGVLCATCIHAPGWIDDPALVAVLDRGGFAHTCEVCYSGPHHIGPRCKHYVTS